MVAERARACEPAAVDLVALPFTLVVPVFDEIQRLDAHVRQLLEYAANLPPGSELVFVDDGSSDGTPERLEKLVADSEAPARVLRRPHYGKGAAVRAGLADAHTPVAGFCDLDLSTPLASFDEVRRAAERAPVLAIGSRDATASTITRAQSPVREFLGRTYNRAVQLALTPGIVDTQCGAKAARREVWDTLLPRSREDGFAWDVEIIAIARASGIGVREVAVEWEHREGTKVNVTRDGTRMVVALRRISRRSGAVRTETTRAIAHRVAGPEEGTRAESGIFTDRNVEALAAADATHWWFRSKAAFVASALRRAAAPTGRLVDLGGGAGGVTAAIGWVADECVVVEGSHELVEVALRRRGLDAICAGVDAVPIGTGAASVVCLLDVIEHLADPLPALREATRSLRFGGVLVVTVPGHPRLWSAADEALGHVRRYTRRALVADLERAGLEVELCSHVFSWLAVPVWVQRRLRSTGRAELGLDVASTPIDRAALVLTSIERLLVLRAGVALPVGTSIIAIARPVRPDGGPRTVR